MSHDQGNPISNETGEYLQELTEKGAEKKEAPNAERTYLVGERGPERVVQKKEPVRRTQGKGGK